MGLFSSFKKKDPLDILSNKLKFSNPYLNKLEMDIFKIRIMTVIGYMSGLYYLAKTQLQMDEDIDVVVEKFINAPSTDKSLDLVYQHTFGGAIGVLLFIAEPNLLSTKERNTYKRNIKNFLTEKGISNTKTIVDTAMAFHDDLTSGPIAVNISKCTAAMLNPETTDMGFFDPSLNLLLMAAVTQCIVSSRNQAMAMRQSHPNLPFKSDQEETRKMLSEVGILSSATKIRTTIKRQKDEPEEDDKYVEEPEDDSQEEYDDEYYDDEI